MSVLHVDLCQNEFVALQFIKILGFHCSYSIMLGQNRKLVYSSSAYTGKCADVCVPTLCFMVISDKPQINQVVFFRSYCPWIVEICHIYKALSSTEFVICLCWISRQTKSHCKLALLHQVWYLVPTLNAINIQGLQLLKSQVYPS